MARRCRGRQGAHGSAHPDPDRDSDRDPDPNPNPNPNPNPIPNPNPNPNPNQLRRVLDREASAAQSELRQPAAPDGAPRSQVCVVS